MDNVLMESYRKLLDARRQLGRNPSEADVELMRFRLRAEIPTEHWEKLRDLWQNPGGSRGAVQLIRGFLDTAASPSRWTQAEAFDSARDCERVRIPVWERAGEEIRQIEERDDPADVEGSRALLVMGLLKARASRCIPASAMYGPQQPAR
jgi:hypothetical protein